MPTTWRPRSVRALYGCDLFSCTLSWSLNSSDTEQRIKRMQRQQRRAKAGWTLGKLLPGSFIAMSSQSMSTVRAWARRGFTLHKWERQCYFEDFQPNLTEQSCVYSTTFGPCIYVAIVCTYSCRDYNTTGTEMFPSLTRLQPRYDVTHTDSDGNAMKKLPGSVSPKL